MTQNTAYLPPLSDGNADGLVLGHRYRVPSGMGGVFDVVLLSLSPESGATVRVHEPRNPDWHNYTFNVPEAALKPIPTVWQVRTGVGRITGEDDDYLSWGKFPQRHEADAAAKSAAKYPSCHPIKICEVEA